MRGAQKWVGRARWNYGSFYLWGDVPALMPITLRGEIMKTGDAGWRERGPGRQLQDRAIKNGKDWFGPLQRRHGSKSIGRKAASAMIAKIPLPLSRHIAAVYRAGVL